LPKCDITVVVHRTNPFPRVHTGADETITTSAYAFDNARRRDANRLVVQRTLAGEAFFRTGRRVRAVPGGWAMLFTHREATGYGYPETATAPYRQRFLALTPGGTLQPIFDRLRRDFGPVVRMAEESEAGALFDEIFHRFNAHSFRDRLHEAELICRLFLALYREQEQGRHLGDPVARGYYDLQYRYRTPLNLKTLAARCGVSREHFIRVFHQRYHESPGAMLRRLRLEHARSLLAATRLGIEDIALASGFVSSSSFCRAYRRRFGCRASDDRSADAGRDRGPVEAGPPVGGRLLTTAAAFRADRSHATGSRRRDAR
jgi:AraC-like DNA-binding protein